jgi:ATP-dependent metalloprotease
MQQAVVSTQNSLAPPTISIVISSFNRNFIRNKINYFIQTINTCIQDVSSVFDEKANTLIIDESKLISSSEKKSLENLRDIFLQLKHDYFKTNAIVNDLNQTLILDPILKPFFDENSLNILKNEPTFYENRFGFSEAELLNCEFSNPFNATSILKSKHTNLLNRNKYKTSFFTNFTQVRGFKTKQSNKEEEDAFKSNPFDSKYWKNALFEKIEDSKTKSNNLGSIFQFTENDKIKNLSQGNKELEDKIKIAFAEGYMQRQAKDDKKGKITPIMVVRYLIIGALIYMLFSQISISTSNGTNGNGKNGGGINIRALTGNVNFEISPEQVNVRFDDVKGLPEAKKELTEIVDFLKDPEKYTKLGARLPKGVLLVGPPGCGKTLLAKSVAGEAGVPFFQASGSDFDEMFVGTGSKRVRQLFSAARAKAPCVIFIDEIDSVGSTRTNSSVHPHANQTINQLLAEMDGFQKNEGVIVLGATNRRETLDAALMRPGRFDVEVRIDKPDFKARVEMLEYYLDKVAKDKNVDVQYLAKQLTGLGGSSIENVVNQAALRAVVTNSSSVKMEHLEWALDRTLMGYGKSRLADEECNKNTAYHEAGHVLVAYFTKDATPLHKVTILPRGKYFDLKLFL